MKQFTLEQYADPNQHTEKLHNHVREITKEVIIEVKKGELKHDQTVYHKSCGEEHCIAGWVELKILEELNIKWSYNEFDSEDKEIELEEFSPLIQKYAVTNELYEEEELTDDLIWDFVEDLLNPAVKGGPINFVYCNLTIDKIIENWNKMVELNVWNKKLLIKEGETQV